MIDQKTRSISLEDSGLSFKVCKKLSQSNIFTLEDLIDHTEIQLMNIPLLGPGSINEIKNLLNEKGLKLYFDGEGISIEELELSLRSYNSLIRNGINSIEALKKKSEAELIKIKGLGTKSVDEIIKKLNSLS